MNDDQRLTAQGTGGGICPVGDKVPQVAPPTAPGQPLIEASWVHLQRLSAPLHADPIHDRIEGHDWLWDYMPVGPFASAEQFAEWVKQQQDSDDPSFYAIVDPDSKTAMGFASFLRIQPAHRVIEIGFITLSPGLQRSRLGSAALMAMIAWAFANGYRRVEWKCNAMNAPSRSAALRLGFSFEGVFRQHMIVKGHNRDTAWFAITDNDWPQLSRAYDKWLSPENFDAGGQQRQSLSSLTTQALPGRREG